MENNMKKEEMMAEIKKARAAAVENLANDLIEKANSSLQENYKKAIEELDKIRIVGYASSKLTTIKRLEPEECDVLCSLLKDAFEPRGFKFYLQEKYCNDCREYYLTVM